MATGERFLFYSSIMETAEKIRGKFGKEAAYDFLEDVINFGLYGEYPLDDSDSWLFGFDTIAAVISSAQERYEQKVEQGKRGGRPKAIPDEDIPLICEELSAAKVNGRLGVVKQEIAQRYGCGIRTIENVFRDFKRKNEKTIFAQEEEHMRKNENSEKTVFAYNAEPSEKTSIFGKNVFAVDAETMRKNEKSDVFSEKTILFSEKSGKKPNNNINNNKNTEEGFFGSAEKTSAPKKIEWEF